MAGFDRYSSVLSLFAEDRGSWTVAEMGAHLGTPSSTVYRVVREMVAAGFLESAAGSYYRLGPAFIEYDRTISMTDPLIRSGAGFLDRLVNDNSIPCAAVLARLYGNKVLCVADARSKSFTRKTSYQRGRPMPVMRGATSHAILAQIKGKRLDKVLKSVAEGSHEDRMALVIKLEGIRKEGFCSTQGEVDAELIGFAVPISNKALGIKASLSCISAVKDFADTHEPLIYANLTTSAKLIEQHMQRAYDSLTEGHGTAESPLYKSS